MGRNPEDVARPTGQRRRLTAYAAGLWKRADVEAVCLELQDRHGQSPALLLWRLWAIDERRTVDRDVLGRAATAVRCWDDKVIGPLRETRRRLKDALPLIPADIQAKIRAEVRAAELNAELALLDALEALTATPKGRQDDGLAALCELTAAWGAPAPTALLRRLATAAA